MRALVAYAPALALLCVGIVAIAAVPPVQHPITCGCTPGPSGMNSCVCATGYSENFLGVAILLATAVAALVYALVVRGMRVRQPLLGRPS